MFARAILPLLVLVSAATIQAKILWDGRVPLSFSKADLDASRDPYLTVVKGEEAASKYTTPLGIWVPPTPLWYGKHPHLLKPTEQSLAVSITNSSVFRPGGPTGRPQLGFRRTDLIAQINWDASATKPIFCQGKKAFHFSILKDSIRQLNLKHEYQIVFIEPSDGSHVFGVQIGSPFTNPTGKLPAKDAGHLKILDHSLNVLFHVPLVDLVWQNFAVIVDWDKRTLQVFHSAGPAPLKQVTGVKKNLSAKVGEEGWGEFHIGLLKLPLVNPKDAPENQGNVVYYGIQEGTTEGLIYSGVFVEDLKDGLSIGNGKTLRV